MQLAAAHIRVDQEDALIAVRQHCCAVALMVLLPSPEIDPVMTMMRGGAPAAPSKMAVRSERKASENCACGRRTDIRASELADSGPGSRIRPATPYWG